VAPAGGGVIVNNAGQALTATTEEELTETIIVRVVEGNTSGDSAFSNDAVVIVQTTTGVPIPEISPNI
jgi:hypothetical protein